MAKPACMRFAGSALGIFAAFVPGSILAAPQTLDCVLTDIEIKGPGSKFDSQIGAEKRTVTVIFDDGAKSLSLKQDGAGAMALADVAMSETSMTGASGNISAGIDRSSWHIVFQTYEEGRTRNEFGKCSLR
jgi:hypothetical protein